MRWFHRLWLGVSIAALFAATPGAAQVATELASILSADDCCGHSCDEPDCCPLDCQDCRYCAHTHALSPATLAIRVPREGRRSHDALALDLHPFAYVSPPARPPRA